MHLDSRPVLIENRLGADVLAVSLLLIFITGAVTLSLMPIVADDLQGRFGFSSADIGLLTSVFMGFYGVAGISSGVFAARWGGRLLAVSCACFVVGSAIFGLSSSLTGFMIGRGIQGIGGGMVITTSSPVLAYALAPERRARAWGILGSGWGLGSMAALLILPTIEKAGGFRAVFFATATLGLVVGIPALSQEAVRGLPRHPAGTTSLRGLARSFGSVVTNYRVLLVGFVNTAALAVGVTMLAWAPRFLEDTHGASKAVSLYLVAGLGAAQFIGNPLGAGATARWGKYLVLVGSLLIMTAVAALTGIVPGITLVFGMVVVAGFFSMFFFPAMMGYIPEIVKKPQEVGPATGITTVMGFAGSLVAPWLFGRILDVGGRSAHSYLGGFLMLAAFPVAAVIGMLFFRRTTQ